MFQPFAEAIDALGLVPDGTSCNVNLRSTKRHVILEIMAGQRPVSVIKYPRTAEENYLEAEAEALERLQAAGLCDGDVEAPTLLRRGEAYGRPFLIEKFLAGTPPPRIAEHEAPAQQVIDWLVRLFYGTSQDGTLAAAIRATLDQVMPHFPDARRIEGPTAAVAAHYRPILMHGDLSYQNLLVTSDRVGVIDWEYARLDGFPVADAIDFLLYDLYRDNKDYAAVARALFSGRARKHAALLRRYCAACGVAAGEIRPFAMLFVLAKLALLVRLSASRAEQKARELLAVLSQLQDDRYAINVDGA